MVQFARLYSININKSNKTDRSHLKYVDSEEVLQDIMSFHNSGHRDRWRNLLFTRHLCNRVNISHASKKYNLNFSAQT